MHVCSVSVYSVLGEEEHTPALSTLTWLSSKLTTALQVRYSGLFSAAGNKKTSYFHYSPPMEGPLFHAEA